MKADTPNYVRAKQAPDAHALQEIRDAARTLRDLCLLIQQTEATLAGHKEQQRSLERQSLPDMFAMAGITKLGLEAEGNMPAYDAVALPYYRANIAASWPEEQKAEAFTWLEKNGGGDLIKTEIVIRLPRKATNLRIAVIKALRKLRVDHTVDLNVPWASLTSFVREYIEKRHKNPPLDVLGADVGRIVRLRPRKED